MTKKYILPILISVLLFEFNLNGQNYESIFGLDTTQWNITYIIPDAGYTEQLFAFGDTLIDGKNYKELFIYNNSEGFLREDTISGKTWYLSWNGSEYLVMDLDKEKGDYFDLISYNDTVQIQIDSVYYNDGKKVLITNYILDQYYESETLRFVEGVGPTNGLFLASHSWTEPTISYLLCSYKDSELEYNTEQFYGDCNVNWTDIKSNTLDKAEVIVYPNPVSSELSFLINSQNIKEYTITIFNINGENLVMNQFSEKITINVDRFTSGIYFYKIADSKKLIQTGKIMII